MLQFLVLQRSRSSMHDSTTHKGKKLASCQYVDSLLMSIGLYIIKGWKFDHPMEMAKY